MPQDLVAYGLREIGHIIVSDGIKISKPGLAVKPLIESMRGQVLGIQVLEHVKAYCRAQGIKAIHLQVEHGNKRAHALDQKSRFRDLNRTPMTKVLD